MPFPVLRLFVLMAAAILISIFGYSSESIAKGYPQIMFIFDASGSMWGSAGGQTKIEAAKNVMAKIVPALPPEVKTGLAVYGHRRKGDCNDIEILVPPGSDERSRLIKDISQLSPRGKTPIAATISMVVDKLKSLEDETTIILVSDGEETCNDDPCGVVRRLKNSGIKFILHVVGFGVNHDQKVQLQCLAEAGGGRYFSAENADTLLSAMETVKEEVHQKVEKAKTTTKKAASKLGKLRITMPKDSTRCLHTFKIIRKKDRKLVKTVKWPHADAIHPLLAGEYEIIAGYANSNQNPDTDVSLGFIKIKGAETTELRLGSLAINIAESLRKMPAGAVIISSDDHNGFRLETVNNGNKFYFYKTRPLPAGKYSLAVHYKGTYLYRTSDNPLVLASGIQVEEGRQSIVTIDTGIQVRKPKDSQVTAWELIPEKTENALIRIERASNGAYPLWQPYAILPGKYDLIMFIKDMNEPLPVGEGLVIGKGELLQFNTGL